jgi:putative ABC transport system permease protein
MRAWLSRIKGFVLGRRADRDLDDEVQFHLDMLAREHERRGMSAADARAAARREFGGVAQAKEIYREQRGLPFLDTLAQDVRYAVRTLVRTPGFTAAALLTLALGTGANTAIFSVVNAVVLKPLPYADPDRLVLFGDRRPDGATNNIGYATLVDYRERARSFEGISALRSWLPTLVVDSEAERVNAMRVSWNYFDLLGVQPALGRGFRREEDRPDRWRVLVISDGLWRRRFGADPGVIDRPIRMNDRDYRIVGVMPRTYEPLLSEHFYDRAEMWAPLGYDVSEPSACRGCRHLRAVGKLRPGASMAAAGDELEAIRTDLARSFPNEYLPADVIVERVQDALAGSVKGGLLAILAAVGLVLLIACANVANLLIARSVNRSREMALRAALGAGPGRLVRQLLTESLLLGAAGGALGIALAWLGLETLLSLAPMTIPRLDQVAVDGRVLAFAVLLSLATGLLFGIVPAWRSGRVNPQRALAETRATAGAASHRTRTILVIADLAVALVLLAGAGLMLRSVGRLLQVDPGFDPRQVLTAQFSLVGRAYAEDPVVSRFIDRVVERVRALPGVEAAAATGQIPMGGNYDQRGFHIEGRIPANTADSPMVERYSVTPGYFSVMRIPLRSGRLFTDADRVDSQPVLLVAESTAQKLWPGEDPIGHRVRLGEADKGPWRTVVGVVGDVRHFSLHETPTLQMYAPQTQITDSFVVLTIRTSVAADSLIPSVRGVLRELDPAVPVYETVRLEDVVARSIGERRFVMQMLGAFAVLALLLAMVGLYGVVSYMVAQRTREVGLRVALGAEPRDILRLILGRGMSTVATGILVGLGAALLLARWLETLLYGTEPHDPLTMAAAAGILAAAALAAHVVPIRHALRVGPAAALRQE